MRWLSHRLMTALGWKVEGTIPDIPKMVIIGAPHTSNWDFFLFLGVLHHFDLEVRFLAKSSLFRWPFGWMFRKIGGIPVDRAHPRGVVAQVKEAFEDEERLVLVIAPEGTRGAAPMWKTGFVEIAEAADVPVVFAAVDGVRKVIEIGPPEMVGPDRADFMDRVRVFFTDATGVRPEGKGPVRLGNETRHS
jgi:1-acyl-sn-glycerol-3-phosphate acyltransferase